MAAKMLAYLHTDVLNNAVTGERGLEGLLF
jgi:hypothetical protein